MKSSLVRLASAGAIAVMVPAAALADVASGAKAAAPTGAQSDLTVSFKNISDTLIYLVGAIAVIMLIIGGLRYVTSQGSSDGVKQAKDTILYGVIGIVVALLAYAIVNFVATSIT